MWPQPGPRHAFAPIPPSYSSCGLNHCLPFVRPRNQATGPPCELASRPRDDVNVVHLCRRSGFTATVDAAHRDQTAAPATVAASSITSSETALRPGFTSCSDAQEQSCEPSQLSASCSRLENPGKCPPHGAQAGHRPTIKRTTCRLDSRLQRRVFGPGACRSRESIICDL